MAWQINDDAAWVQESAYSYRHYTGARVSKRGNLWSGEPVSKAFLKGHKTALDAVLAIHKKRFWGQDGYGEFFGESLGGVYFGVSPISSRYDPRFVFRSSGKEAFPNFIIATINRNFIGNAMCVGCSLPLAEFSTRIVRNFDGPLDEPLAYLVCECGYPVFQMKLDLFYVAESALRENSKPWLRKQALNEAGGKHTRKEIREILALQNGCCIYCDTRFTDELRPTRDHLLPLAVGGGDWALNIALACRKCNSKRCDTPFHEYCESLGYAQHGRILGYLQKRLAALNGEQTPREAIDCFAMAMAYRTSKKRKRSPSHPYRAIERVSDWR